MVDVIRGSDQASSVFIMGAAENIHLQNCWGLGRETERKL